MNRPLKEYLKYADDLAQQVINAWGSSWHAGIRSFPPEFNELLEPTFRYHDAKRVADNHREFGNISKRTAAEESESRVEFAKAYKKFRERHERN